MHSTSHPARTIIGLSLTVAATALTGSLALAWQSGQKDVTPDVREQLEQMAPGAPLPADGEFVHIPPTMDELESSEVHPKLKEAIRRGHDLFINTQQLRGKNVFNDLNCVSCHMGEGRLPHAAPVWPAVLTLPDYRGKNDHVNSLEERIAGCFSFSMNGIPPEYGSDDMVALVAYHHWLAKGAPLYPEGAVYGRGYGAGLATPEESPDRIRGQKVYEAHCALCHGEEGQGTRANGQAVFPPLWGDHTYNWGAGMSKVENLAGFVKNNMPLGAPRSLTDQQAWDVALYINSHERPQDPRFTGDARETREKEIVFHKGTLYGTEVDGELLGAESSLGGKPILKPEALRGRSFAAPTSP